MTARLHPTACVIVALPRDPRAARQAAEPMLGVTEAIPLSPLAVVAAASVALPGKTRRVGGRADWGALATADAPTVHDALRAALPPPVVRELYVTDTSTVLESVDPSRVEK